MNSLTLDDYKYWGTIANKKLENIYNELCDFESMLIEGLSVPKLLELLETVNEIREHYISVVEKIEWSQQSVRSNRNELQLQMDLLEKSINLLKIEAM